MKKNMKLLFHLIIAFSFLALLVSSAANNGRVFSKSELQANNTIKMGEQILQNPYGIALDEVRGFIYIADTGNNLIRKFNMNGVFIDSFGGSGSGEGQFYQPQGVGIDPSNGDIYVVDTTNNRIQKFDSGYNFLNAFGAYGSGDNQFYLPRDIAVASNGDVFICDSGNDRIVKYSSAGNFIRIIGIDSYLFEPSGIDIDGNDNIYIADSENHRIVKFDVNGVEQMEFGYWGFGDGELFSPKDVAVNSQGVLYVADTENYRIQKFDSQGYFLESFESIFGYIYPQKISCDTSGNLYFIDSDLNSLMIHKISTFIDNINIQPSPFSPNGDEFEDSAFVSFSIEETAKITITVYDEIGELVRTLLKEEPVTTLDNTVEWDGKNDEGIFVGSGIYTIKIDAVTASLFHAPQQSAAVTVYLPHCEISGNVTDGEYPIYHARVTDGYRETYTDLNGDYRLSNVPVGNYLVAIEKTGYTADPMQVVLSYDGENAVDVNFLLNALGARNALLSGKITDISSNPLEGVKIMAGNVFAFTDQMGEYVLDDIPAGDYNFTASKRGYASVFDNGLLNEGQILQDYDFMLEVSDVPDVRIEPGSLSYHIMDNTTVQTTSFAGAIDMSVNINFDENNSGQKGEIIPGEYIIKLRNNLYAQKNKNLSGYSDIKFLKRNKKRNVYLVKDYGTDNFVQKNRKFLTDKEKQDITNQNIEKFKKRIISRKIMSEDEIEYIEPNRKVYAFSSGVSHPDDAFFDDQWALENMNVSSAWIIESGNGELRVAVVDSGIDYTHSDLMNNYLPIGYDWVDDDSDPFPAPNGQDDDGDGLIDEGIDHGTHVAGIIGASTNNASGIAGIADVKIIAYRVLNSDGNGSSFDVAEAIDQAVADGAKIINLSLGGGGTSLEQTACQNAWDNGRIVVGAAGNDYGRPVNFPAAYPSVIAVSAITESDTIASFSNIGPEIEVAAPGVDILSTIPNEGYRNANGTSMACPNVTGVIALMWSVNPELSNDQIRMILHNSSTDIGESGFDNYFGYGKVDAFKAVMMSSENFDNKTISLFNDGGENLEITGIEKSNDWLYLDKDNFILEPGESNHIFAIIDRDNFVKGSYSDTIIINTNDPDEGSLMIPVIVEVDNRSPVLELIGDREINENQFLEILVNADDIDGDEIFYQATGLPAGASFDNNSSVFQWQPNYDQSGEYQILFSVSDGDILVSEEITITVNNVNRSPSLAFIGSKTIDEMDFLEITLSAIDLDGDNLIFNASNLPGGASFDSDNALFMWQPQYDQAGVYQSIVFTVSDGDLSTSEEINITVLNVNRAPALDFIKNQSLQEGSYFELLISGSDPDGEVLTFSADSLPSGALMNMNTGLFSWTPAYNQSGEYQIDFYVSDSDLSDTQQVLLTVEDINVPPVLNPIGSKTIAEGELFQFIATAEDLGDENKLRWSGYGFPEGASIESTTGLFQWTPSYTQAGSYGKINIEVTDGEFFDNEVITITVTNTNRSPELMLIGNKMVNENELLEFFLQASDPDNDPLTFKALNLPLNANFDSKTKLFSWIPDFDQAGNYENIVFEVSDGDLTCSESIAITVYNTNRMPELAAIGNQVVTFGETLNFTVNATDPDNDTLVFSVQNLPEGAVFDAATGEFNWLTDENDLGEYSGIIFTVSDGDLSVSEEIKILVRNVPLAIVECEYAYEYSFGGDTPPFISGDILYNGNPVLEFGDIDDNQNSILEISIEILEDIDFSFYLKTSCEQSYDKLVFFINDNQMGQWSGADGDWIKYSRKMTSGQYTLRWKYQKDYSESIAQDTAWISLVALKPDLPLSLADIITTDYKYTHVLGGVSEPFITEDVTYNGDLSLQFGAITHDQYSFIELTTTILKDATLSFYRKVSSESGYDFLEFYIDGQKITSWAGERDWAEYVYDLSAGVHVLKWQYIKDNSNSKGLDTAWITNVVIAPQAITLDPPSNVSATDGIYTDRVRITWDYVNNSDSYIVYRAPEYYGEYLEIGSVTGLSLDDYNVVQNQGYYYKVQAYSSLFGYSELSDYTTGFAREIIFNSRIELTDGSVSSYTNDTFIHNGDVYIAGYIYVDGNSQACYWMNGQLTVLTYEGTKSNAYSIWVDQSDVYVAGYYESGGMRVGCYWKNNTLVELTGPHYYKPSVTRICVDSGQVIACGANENGERVYWIDGVEHTLTQLTDKIYSMQSMSVENGDVYILGLEEIDTAHYKVVYWINGNLNYIDNEGSLYDFATDIFVSNGDIYISGTKDFNGHGYWKNSVFYPILQEVPATINKIFVDGPDVYLGGYSNIDNTTYYSVCYWKNGERVFLGENSTIGNQESVTSLFIYNDIIYAGGHYFENSRFNACYWMKTQ